jgi:hypothetical protein
MKMDIAKHYGVAAPTSAAKRESTPVTGTILPPLRSYRQHKQDIQKKY